MKYSLVLALILLTVVALVRTDKEEEDDDERDKSKKSGKRDRISERGEELKEKLKKFNKKNATRGEIKGFFKNITRGGDSRILGRYIKSLNCSQRKGLLNDTKGLDCSMLEALAKPIEECRKMKDMAMMKDNVRELLPFVKCGLIPKNISKDDFFKIIKSGGLKGALKEVLKNIGKHIEDIIGKAGNWTVDDIKAIGPLLRAHIPNHVLKKVKLHVLEKAFKDLPKLKRGILVCHVTKEKYKGGEGDVTSICESDLGKCVKKGDAKALSKEKAKNISSRCFTGADPATRREMFKKKKAKNGTISEDEASDLVYLIDAIPRSVLKHGNNSKHLLEAFMRLNKTDRNGLEIDEYTGKILLDAASKRFGDRSTWTAEQKKILGPLKKFFTKGELASLPAEDLVKHIKEVKKPAPDQRLRSCKTLEGKSRKLYVKHCLGTTSSKDNITLEDVGLDNDDYVPTLDPRDEYDDDDGCDDDGEDDGEDGGDEDDGDDGDDGDDDDGDDEDAQKGFRKHRSCPVLPLLPSAKEWSSGKLTKVVGLLVHRCMNISTLADLPNDALLVFLQAFQTRSKVLDLKQCRVIVSRVENVTDLTGSDSEVLEYMGEFVACLSTKKLLEVPDDMKDAVLEQLIKSKKLWALSDQVKLAVAKAALKMVKVDDLSKMDGETVVKLFPLLCWLDDGDFAKIPATPFGERLSDIRDNVEEFSCEKGFEKCAKRILAKRREYKKQQGKEGESIADVDSIDDMGEKICRAGISDEDVKTADAEAVDKLARKGCGDKKAKKEMKKKKDESDAKVSRRKKREAIDYSLEDSDYFLNLGDAILGLTSSEIAQLTPGVFEDIVGTVSQVSGWDNDQLLAWANKAKQAWGNPGTFTDDELLLLNNFVKGFTGDEINSMKLDTDEVVSKLGSVKGYTTDQLNKGFAKIKSYKPVNQMDGVDLQTAGQFVLGMTAADIAAINSDAFDQIAYTFGKYSAWNSAQLTAIKNQMVSLFGDTSTWRGEALSTAGTAIGGFTNDELKAFPADSVQYIPHYGLATLSADQFKQLSTAVIGALSGAQANAITDDQKSGLSEEQKRALEEALVEGYIDTDDTPGDSTPAPGGDSTPGGGGDKSGSFKATVGIISFLLPFLWVLF